MKLINNWVGEVRGLNWKELLHLTVRANKQIECGLLLSVLLLTTICICHLSGQNVVGVLYII